MKRVALYDISDSTLREKVSSMLMDYGFIRIQKSAMVAEIKPHLLLQLKNKLDRITLQPNEDIMILRLCRDCEKDIYRVTSKALPTQVPVIVY